MALLPWMELLPITEWRSGVVGQPEYTPLERTTARPTLEVLSFHAGPESGHRGSGKGSPFLAAVGSPARPAWS